MVKPDSNARGIGIDSSDDVYVTGGGAPNKMAHLSLHGIRQD